MPRYAIVFHGSGLALPVDGNAEVINGFYTTRFESGIDERNAFRKAYNRLMNEEKIKELSTNEDFEFKLEMNSIEEVAFFRGRLGSVTGLAFYTNEE